MKRKGAIRLLLFALLCILTAMSIQLGARWQQNRVTVPHEGKVLGVPVVSDLTFLQDKIKRTIMTDPGVCYEGVRLPFDTSGLCFLSQNIAGDWTGKISAGEEDTHLYLLADDYLYRKQDAITEGHEFILIVEGPNSYGEVKLVVSGMPVIALNEERREDPPEIDEDEDPQGYMFDRDYMSYGTIRVFNPGVGTGQYEILESRVRYHEKGGITRGFYKRSFALSLQNSEEQNIDVSLLGMRSDNSWKLNSMVTDPNKIREKTTAKIWEQIDKADTMVKTPGQREEYVELILNNEYWGMYCLVEPVDEKKLSMDRNDILYKMYGEEPSEDANYQEAIDNHWNLNSTVRLRYPEIITDYALAWYPMRDYTNTFMWSESAAEEAVSDKLNIANLCDNYLYLMVCSGSDNMYKNNLYLAKVDAPGDYTMYRIPWDMDLTFGNAFMWESPTKSYFEEDYTVEYLMWEWNAVMASNPEAVSSLLRERYREYRKSFLSTESIHNLLIDNRDYIVESGAMQREMERWPDYNTSPDIEYLLEYQEKRMEWLDGYFGWEP